MVDDGLESGIDLEAGVAAGAKELEVHAASLQSTADSRQAYDHGPGIFTVDC